MAAAVTAKEAELLRVEKEAAAEVKARDDKLAMMARQVRSAEKE